MHIGQPLESNYKNSCYYLLSLLLHYRADEQMVRDAAPKTCCDVHELQSYLVSKLK